MSRLITGRLAWSVVILTIAMLTAGVWLDLQPGMVSAGISAAWPFVPVELSFAIVGAVVASRRPRNPLGWLFLANGAFTAFASLLTAYADYGLYAAHPVLWPEWAAWISHLSIEASTPVLVFPLLLFPHGHLPSPRWKVIGWLAVGAALGGGLSAAVADVNFSRNFPGVRDPLQLFPGSAIRPVYSVLQAASLLCLGLAGASVVLRLRRARAEERRQLKWVAYSSALAVLGFVGIALAGLPVGPVLAFVVLVPLIPIAAGIAILKYRLYDIDVVINRTLVYGALAAFITAVYVGVVVGIGALIGSGGQPNLALSILATALVAVAFQPVKARVEAVANRLVYGYRATPYEALTQFSHRVAGIYADEEVLTRLARVLVEGTGASVASVWIRSGGEAIAAATWPEAKSPLATSVADRVAEVRHQGETLGELSIKKRPGEPFTPLEEKLLNDLAAQAGQVLRNVRLTSELQARLGEISGQAVELRASRQRIVAAQDAERRRLERNIHDGAQQHLVALAVKLRLAATLAKRDPAKARRSLKELEAQTAEARQTLRDLAQGIYPPALREGGLVQALGPHAEVTAHGVGRYDPEIEAGVYFSCLEAVQNATKYAKASRVRVDLRQQNGHLVFSVIDDGVGFDPTGASTGTGVQNMKDRVASLGGRLSLESQPGKGTTVSGELPLAAPTGVAR